MAPTPTEPRPAPDPDVVRFLSTVHPYDALRPDALEAVAARMEPRAAAEGAVLFEPGDVLPGLFLVVSGAVETRDENGVLLSELGPTNSFGERGLQRDGRAVASARATEASDLLLLPPDGFRALLDTEPAARRFFDRRPARAAADDPATLPLDALMTRDVLTCAPGTPVRDAAARLSEIKVCSICVTEGDRLVGIATLADLAAKVVAPGLPPDTPIHAIMTPDPVALPPTALGLDVLSLMAERGIGHVPVAADGRLLGIVTRTDLTRALSLGPGDLARQIARADDADAIATVTAKLPDLLAQLVATGRPHWVVTRLVSDVADAATRRLIVLAEAELGPPPHAYAWIACGSQGRREQTGVSDQDNGLILSDDASADDPWFAALAARVCGGLDRAGYVLCPGDMMATNQRWRRPLRGWQADFASWIARPGPEARMLASTMFDLRTVAGDPTLLDRLAEASLSAASGNSIFVAHMMANALTHAPPLGLLRGLATIRSGEHRRTLDLKMNGVVPVTDLARVLALRAGLPAVNTRARLEGAIAAGRLSAGGGRELIDAYDLIAQTRLAHQARLHREGGTPDNYLPPADLSDFERSHLRDAFVVVKAMQSALGHGTGTLG